jgi:hypothetical protein
MSINAVVQDHLASWVVAKPLCDAVFNY